jgi:dUTP pyrophosphatase
MTVYPSTLPADDVVIERVSVKIRLLDDLARLPKAATFGDAGFDLHSVMDVTIQPGATVVVKTGLAIEIPSNTVALVCSRSGLAAKHSVFVLNSPGIVDSGYRGEVAAILHNASETPFVIEVGDRIAQLMIQHYLAPDFTEVTEFAATERGEGGFGSTGVK